MLKKLKLAYFRQHIDLELNFGPGLNAIRGANEAGKSTCLEAFFYFCFGVGALRESLEHVVTYHQPVSKLRVDVELEHLGVTYTGYRGKSGAEVSFGNEKVTGQREVTKFFERLFGASADMAGKLMFASQKSLAESLKAGPTEAGRMIEDLANFDLIDRVAEAIAARRQTGATAGVEGRIEALQAQIALEEEAEDLGPLREDVVAAEREVHVHESALKDLRARRTDHDVEQAKQTVSDHAAHVRHIEELTYEIDQIDRALARPAVEGPNDTEMAAARAAVEAAKQQAKAALLHAELVKASTAMQWDEDLAALQAEVVKTQQTLAAAEEGRQEAEQALQVLCRDEAEEQRSSDVLITQLEGRLIRETTCALCQKDLTDVPEVVGTNNQLQGQIREEKDRAKAALAGLARKVELKEKALAAERVLIAVQRQYLRDLNVVVDANVRVEQLYARAADFIEVDRSVVPGQWRWTGPALAAGGGEAANRLKHLETLQRDAMEDAAMRRAKAEQRTKLAAARAVDIQKRDALPLADAKETLEQAGDLDQEIRDVAAVLYSYQGVLQRLQSTLQTKEALAAQQARQLEQVRQQLAAAQIELAAMQRYNLLIKKVRAARPVITNKLWNIVLAGVSKHFTEVRGAESRITRADGMFKCNGFPVSGLSGSAEDMLGLAMRITLTRTFLPGIDMLQLDEPAAACSDARETRMLGMLSTLGFGQIIVVSHSDLTDSVADRIITV